MIGGASIGDDPINPQARWPIGGAISLPVCDCRSGSGAFGRRRGAAQADKYLDELEDGIKELADNAEMGAKRDYMREGYRVLFINSHAGYYAVAPSAIHIIRALHGQMDPGKHL